MQHTHLGGCPALALLLLLAAIFPSADSILAFTDYTMACVVAVSVAILGRHRGVRLERRAQLVDRGL